MKSSLRPILLTASLGCLVASIGCGAGSAMTGATAAKDSRIRGIVVSSAGGTVGSSARSSVVSSATATAAQSTKPVAGVRVSVANTGQSVVTNTRGQFVLDTPVGSNRVQFDNGARGSVNVNTAKGMEANVAVALSGQNAVVTCLANQPIGSTNAASACDLLGGGGDGDNGSNGTNGEGGHEGDNGGNQGGGGENGGSNGGN